MGKVEQSTVCDVVLGFVVCLDLWFNLDNVEYCCVGFWVRLNNGGRVWWCYGFWQATKREIEKGVKKKKKREIIKL